MKLSRKTSSLALSLLLALPIQAMNNANGDNNKTSSKRLYGIAAVSMGALYYGSSLCHEYAHKLVGEALLENRGTVHLGTAPHCVWEKPIDINSWRTLAMVLAGPLASIATTLGFLKISNIIDEYCSGKSFFMAIKEGIKKPFFLHLGNHNKEMLAVRLIALANLLSALHHLTPYQMGHGYSDGYWALQSLKLLLNKTPKKIEQPNPSWWQRVTNWTKPQAK